jgi:hypothetical protein
MLSRLNNGPRYFFGDALAAIAGKMCQDAMNGIFASKHCEMPGLIE